MQNLDGCLVNKKKICWTPNRKDIQKITHRPALYFNSSKDTPTSLRIILKIEYSIPSDTQDFLYDMACQTQLWSVPMRKHIPEAL